MRKKTVNHLADTIFWYILYFLPVIAYLVFTVSGASSTPLPINDFLGNIGLGFATDNIIVTSLSGLFGSQGVLPLFTTDTPIIIFSWFIGVFITHLAVDVLLFIPRLCHKWLNAYCKED